MTWCYRQEEPHCASVSFDRHAANIFQTYVSSALAFSIKRGGILYGNKDEEGNTMVHAIYEPPQVLQWHMKQSRQKRSLTISICAFHKPRLLMNCLRHVICLAF